MQAQPSSMASRLQFRTRPQGKRARELLHTIKL